MLVVLASVVQITINVISASGDRDDRFVCYACRRGYSPLGSYRCRGSRLGLASTTCVVRAQMARAHEMLLSCAREEPNDESFESISQTRVMMASGSLSRFKDADDMFASLGI